MSSLPLPISTPQSVPEITPPASFDGSRTPPSDQVRGASIHTPPSDPRKKAASSDRDFPQVPRIIEAIHSIQCGVYPLQLVYQLAKGEFEEIRRQLKGSGALHQLRYDYDARTDRFVIHMADRKHDTFSALVQAEIHTQLQNIATGSSQAARFAQDIIPLGTSKDSYPLAEADSSKVSIHSPDGQFLHKNARYSAVVIEVANSQRWKELPKLAGSYILDSKALVRVVIGFDFPYGPRATYKATISIWRLHTDHIAKTLQVVANPDQEAFRDESGNPTQSSGLRLRLSDFAPKKLSEVLGNDDDCDIVISTDRLCQFLTEAEDLASALKRRRSEDSADVDWVTGYTVVKPPSSPPERIASDDEAGFAEQEQQALEQADAADPEWGPPAQRRRR